MRRRFLALMLSIPLAASGVAGVVFHVCHSMGGVIVGDCDCEKQAHHDSHEGHAGHHAAEAAHDAPIQLKRQRCCTLEISSASQPLATQEVPSVQVDKASVAFAGPTDHGVTASKHVCDLGLFRERGPPNVHGPPIFVRNCSFLN